MALGNAYKSCRNTHGWLQRSLFPSGYSYAPMQVNCLLTARCNLNCEFCYLVHQGSLQQRKHDELTTDEWKRVFKQFPRFSVVTFTGGEPAVRRDFFELLETAAKKHPVHVTSNGLFLSKENCHRLVELRNCRRLPLNGLAVLSISLLGNEDTHDSAVRIKHSFRRTIEGLATLSRIKRQVGAQSPVLNLKVLVTNRNYRALGEMLPVIAEINPSYITIQVEAMIPFPWYDPKQGKATEAPLDVQSLYAHPPEAACDDPEALLAVLQKFDRALRDLQIKRRYYPDTTLAKLVTHFKRNEDQEKGFCISPWSDLFIGPWGDVGICLGGTVGNVREASLKQLFNSPKFRQFRALLRKERIFPACRGCCFYQTDGK